MVVSVAAGHSCCSPLSYISFLFRFECVTSVNVCGPDFPMSASTVWWRPCCVMSQRKAADVRATVLTASSCYCYLWSRSHRAASVRSPEVLWALGSWEPAGLSTAISVCRILKMTSVRKRRPVGCQGAVVMLLQITISPFSFVLKKKWPMILLR